MRLLTLYQPWGTLMAARIKQIETRHWSTSYRSLVAIHGGKNRSELNVCRESEFAAALERCPALLPSTWFPTDAAPTLDDTLPMGKLLAVGRLANCLPSHQAVHRAVDGNEVAFGNYAAGRFGFVFEDIVPLTAPVGYRGEIGLAEMKVARLADSLTRFWESAMAGQR